MSKEFNIDYLKNLKDSMFSISKSVHDLENIDDLYKTIHRSISEVIHTNNFFIAKLDKKNNLISFPYYIDSND